MSRFTFCNCPAGFDAEPERHAPDCPGRSGAGKARTPVPATKAITDDQRIAVLENAYVRAGEREHALRVELHAAKQKNDALQERLNAADQGKDDLETQNKLLRHDLASNLETFAAICTKLGIDVEAASDAPGKPSDVFVAHVNNLVFQLNDREGSRRDWFEEAQRLQAELDKRPSQIAMSLQTKIKGLQAKLSERDALLRDLLKCNIGFDMRERVEEALCAIAEPSAPKCETCNDHGEIGCLRPDGYDSEPCPECAVPSAPVERDERADTAASAIVQTWENRHE